jgi:hypothetical protein
MRRIGVLTPWTVTMRNCEYSIGGKWLELLKGDRAAGDACGRPSRDRDRGWSRPVWRNQARAIADWICADQRRIAAD